MKRILSVLALGLMLGVGCATAQVVVNTTNFPDATFRSYVKTNFDTDGNGTLSAAEIAAATKIDVNSSNITSLKGIEYFTALQYLDCYLVKIESLDISANTALQYLDCGNNSISSLNISHCPELTYLDCSSCGLDSIDISHNAKLGVLYVDGNNLRKIDFSNDSLLYFISVERNPINSIDVSCCPNLDSLSCSNTHVKFLDVTKNPKLTYLYCSYDSITSIDLSKNPLLTCLGIDNCRLISIDLSVDTLLTELYINDNEKLSELDLSNQKRLQKLECFNCSLSSLDVSAAGDSLKWLWCQHNQLSKLDVSKNTMLESLNCQNNHLVAIDLSANSKLTFTGTNDNSKEVNVNDKWQMDISTLFPFGFDLAKVKYWIGGSGSGYLSGNIFTFGANTNAQYNYDCGNNHAEIFTLIPKVSTGVNTVSGASVKAFATGNVINITGTDAQARVWDVAGRAVYSGADRQINVASAGVYIVKVADKTFKVVVR
jgi:hypothetical protein